MRNLLIALLLALPFTSTAEKNKTEKSTEATSVATAIPSTAVEGVIADVSNYTPLSGVKVNITCEELKIAKTVQTDKEGHFSVEGIPAGNYKVQFERDGYEPLTRKSLIVQNDKKNSFGFFMFED